MHEWKQCSCIFSNCKRKWAGGGGLIMNSPWFGAVFCADTQLKSATIHHMEVHWSESMCQRGLNTNNSVERSREPISRWLFQIIRSNNIWISYFICIKISGLASKNNKETKFWIQIEILYIFLYTLSYFAGLSNNPSRMIAIDDKEDNPRVIKGNWELYFLSKCLKKNSLALKKLIFR